MTVKRKTSESIGSNSTQTPPRRTTVSSEKSSLIEKVIEALLWLWGSNCFGQLGFGEEEMEKTRPTLSTLKEKVKDVAVGGMHTVALTVDGMLWSFGVNDDGALGRDTSGIPERSPIQYDPTVPGVVKLPYGTAPPVQVACTDSASFVLLEDGTIFGWGTFRNANGAFGFSPTVPKQDTPVCVYKASGRQAPVIKLATGGNHVVAVLQDGSAISWGDGDQGQLGRISLRHSSRNGMLKKNMLRPTKIGGCRNLFFVDAFCGEYGTYLKTIDGKFFVSGLNNSGQLAICPADNTSNETSLTMEGRIQSKITFLKPTEVGDLKSLGIEEVAAGKDHALGLDKSGRLFSWGAPTYGVLGRQDLADQVHSSTPYPTPTEVNGFDKDITSIAAGQVISGCIDSDGDVYTWGANLNEMLGFESDDDIVAPRKVPRTKSMKDKKFYKLGFGGQHSMMMGE